MYGLKPTTTAGNPGSSFTYHYDSDGIEDSEQYPTTTITLYTPDTLAANWALHASAIWASSIYLGDHISHLELPLHPRFKHTPPLSVLELGASAGLPGLLIAKLFPNIAVTCSDYPDEEIMKTLDRNVELNQVPHAWGADTSALLCNGGGYDVIVAADTLWNSASHQSFVDTLTKVLNRSSSSRIHLIAGLHTGRYSIQHFLRLAQNSGFEIEEVIEREIGGHTSRRWDVDREGHDDGEQRRWVVWTRLKWHSLVLSHGKEQL